MYVLRKLNKKIILSVERENMVFSKTVANISCYYILSTDWMWMLFILISTITKVYSNHLLQFYRFKWRGVTAVELVVKIENKIKLLPLHGNKAKSFFLTGEVERSTIIYSITSQNTMHLITVFKLRIYFICKERDLLTHTLLHWIVWR